MDKENVNSITKKLQDLVKNRNTPTIVVKQGSAKYNSRTSGTGGVDTSYYPASETEQ